MFAAVVEPGIKAPLINLIPKVPDPRCFKRNPSELTMSSSPNAVE